MKIEEAFNVWDAVIGGKFIVEGILTNGLLCRAADDDADYPALVLVPFHSSALEEEHLQREADRNAALDNAWGV